MFFLPTGEHEAAHADAQDPRHAAAPVQRLEAATIARARDLVEKSDVRGGLEPAAASAAAAAAAADAADLDGGAGHRGETIPARGRATSAKETSQ